MTDPKPPAASGDRYDAEAERVTDAWHDPAGSKTLAECVAAALRAAAKEAQLRVLDEIARRCRGGHLHGVAAQTCTAILTEISKEGPL